MELWEQSIEARIASARQQVLRKIMWLRTGSESVRSEARQD
jgi:hypothetical protein